MTLTHHQINELLEQFNQQLIIFAASTSGPSYLSAAEKHTLQQAGVDIDSLYKESNDIVKLNFYLGLLSQVIGHDASQHVTFDQLKRYIQSGQHFALTEREQATIDSIKRQALTDIRTNQGKIFSDVNNVAKQHDSIHRGQQEFIKETIIEGVSKRQTVKQIATDLARLTGDWSRNFSKSVQYISHTALNEGRLALIERRGEGAKVYFQVQPDACQHCVRLYLTAGPGSAPILFDINQLLANGSNIGRKVSEWKATVEPIHVHCRCLLTEYLDGTKWNGRRFAVPIEQSYVSPIARKKIEVAFNGQKYFV